MKMKMTLIATSVLAANIAAIKGKRAEYDKAVQEAALQVIGQAWEHRNITPARNLIEAVSPHDRVPLVAFLEKWGPMKWDTKGKKLAFLDKDGKFKEPGSFEKFEDEMMKAKWTDARKAPEPKSIYDGPAEISNLLERLKKKAAKGATVKGLAIVNDVHAAYCAAVAKHYGEEEVTTPNGGQQPTEANVAGVVQADRVNELAQSAADKATAEQLAKLAEHFNGQPQVKAA